MQILKRLSQECYECCYYLLCAIDPNFEHLQRTRFWFKLTQSYVSWSFYEVWLTECHRVTFLTLEKRVLRTKGKPATPTGHAVQRQTPVTIHVAVSPLLLSLKDTRAQGGQGDG